MARLQRSKSSSVSLESLHHPVVFVVDMINGFAREGALADPAILQAAAPIRKLIEESQAPVWFIRDSHTPDAAEFQSFPVHSLEGSEESMVIDELKDLETASHTLYKNCISAAASPQFASMLESLPEEGADLIVTGCCTDLCVLQLALPLQSWINQTNRKNMRVIVPEDCVETYHIPDVHDAAKWNETALAMMAANGIFIAGSVEKE